MRPQLQRLREHLEPIGIAPAEALALLILLAGAATLAGIVWWTGRPPPQPPPPLTVTSDAPLPGASAPRPSGQEVVSTPEGEVVVHVAGHVVHPGVRTLPAGARVGDAIQAAGGATDEGVLDGLNLARTLVDGEQVRVPGPGEDPAPTPEAAPDAAAPLDLNTATIEQLQTLPGIGPVMAQRIVEHRTSIGGFVAVTQLLEVPGIGPGRFAELQPRVAV